MRKNIKNKIVALSLLMGMSLMLNVLVPTTRLLADDTESSGTTSTEKSNQESGTEETTKKTEASQQKQVKTQNHLIQMQEASF